MIPTNTKSDSDSSYKPKMVCPSFSRVFDIEANDHNKDNRQSPFESRFPINIGITGFVALTGETLNIPDAYEDPKFDPAVDEEDPFGFRHKHILCMPIYTANRTIIGVIQLINKLNGNPFNSNDVMLMEVSQSIITA